MQVLEERLRGRHSDSEETIRTRLANAVDEMAFAHREGKYEHTMVNDELGRVKAEIVGLVHTIQGC
jgi:guanylate kinase